MKWFTALIWVGIWIVSVAAYFMAETYNDNSETELLCIIIATAVISLIKPTDK